MPFSRSISSAAARFGQQSANIAQTSTANINQIMLSIANMRAQGIMEGSRVWANALQQLGVTAQNYPMIKRQMEAYDYEKSQRPLMERYRGAQIGALEARAAGDRSQAEERQNKSLALTIYSQVGNNPNEVAKTIKSLEMQGRGIEPLVAQIHQTAREKIEEEASRLLTLSKEQRNAEIANNAEIRRVTGILKTTLDDPAATDTEKQFAYQAAAKRLAEIKPSLDLGETIDEAALTNINLAHSFSISLEELEKKLKPPEPSDRMKQRNEFVAQWYINNPDQPKNAKTDRIAKEAFELQKATEGGTALERAIIREKGRFPTAEEVKTATSTVELRQREIALRERAIKVEEEKLVRGRETPDQLARKAEIIMRMVNLYDAQGSKTPQADAEKWYDEVTKQLAKPNVSAPRPPEPSATPAVPAKDIQIYQGYEYTFDGTNWVRGKKAQ